MKRRLLNLLTLLSLLLCIVVVVLWVRSYFADDRIRLIRSAGQRLVTHDLISVMGVLAYSRQMPDREWWTARTNGMESERLFRPGLVTFSSRPRYKLRFVDKANGSIAGFWFGRFDADLPHAAGGLPTVELWVPHWLLAMILAPLPAVRIASHIRRIRRRRGGHCPCCGYDLRATPGQCPECGMVTEPHHRPALLSGNARPPGGNLL